MKKFKKLFKRIRIKVGDLLNVEGIKLSYFRQYDVITQAYVAIDEGRITTAKKILSQEMIESSDPQWWIDAEEKKQAKKRRGDKS